MGILVGTGRTGCSSRTGCTGCTLPPLGTCAAIRISGIIRLTRGGLLGLLVLALLVLTLPAAGITPLTLPPITVTIPAGCLTLLLALPVLTLPGLDYSGDLPAFR